MFFFAPIEAHKKILLSLPPQERIKLQSAYRRMNQLQELRVHLSIGVKTHLNELSRLRSLTKPDLSIFRDRAFPWLESLNLEGTQARDLRPLDALRQTCRITYPNGARNFDAHSRIHPDRVFDRAGKPTRDLRPTLG